LTRLPSDFLQDKLNISALSFGAITQSFGLFHDKNAKEFIAGLAGD
jgi:hypothetical protein